MLLSWRDLFVLGITKGISEAYKEQVSWVLRSSNRAEWLQRDSSRTDSCLFCRATSELQQLALILQSNFRSSATCTYFTEQLQIFSNLHLFYRATSELQQLALILQSNFRTSATRTYSAEQLQNFSNSHLSCRATSKLHQLALILQSNFRKAVQQPLLREIFSFICDTEINILKNPIFNCKKMCHCMHQLNTTYFFNISN